MRTTLDLDPKLLDEVRREIKGKSKKAIVEQALRELLATRRRKQAADMIGKFEIDLTPEDLRKLRGK